MLFLSFFSVCAKGFGIARQNVVICHWKCTCGDGTGPLWGGRSLNRVFKVITESLSSINACERVGMCEEITGMNNGGSEGYQTECDGFCSCLDPVCI